MMESRSGKTKMTNMFIRYCVATEAWADATQEDRKKYHAKLKESCVDRVVNKPTPCADLLQIIREAAALAQPEAL